MTNPNFDPNIGKKFTSDYQPENAGRKKNLFSWLKEEYSLSQSDVNNIIDYLSLYPFEKYDELVKKVKDKDESLHGMPKILADFILAYDKAKLDDIIKILKASGKASDKTELTTPEGIEIIFRNKTKNETDSI